MYFEIFFFFYQTFKNIFWCLRYLASLAASHPKKVIVALNLALAYFRILALMRAQELSRGASVALEKCQEAFDADSAAQMAIELAMAEKSIENFDNAQYRKLLGLGIIIACLVYLAFRTSKIDFSTPPPSNVAISPEPPSPSSSGEVSTGSVGSQAGGEGLDLDDSSIESLGTISCGFSEELTETDFSVLVPETLESSVPELLSNIVSLLP